MLGGSETGINLNNTPSQPVPLSTAHRSYIRALVQQEITVFTQNAVHVAFPEKACHRAIGLRGCLDTYVTSSLQSLYCIPHMPCPHQKDRTSSLWLCNDCHVAMHPLTHHSISKQASRRSVYAGRYDATAVLAWSACKYLAFLVPTCLTRSAVCRGRSGDVRCGLHVAKIVHQS